MVVTSGDGRAKNPGHARTVIGQFSDDQRGLAMAAATRSPHPPTDEWDQLRLLVTSPEQATYELLRPIVLFGRSSGVRARETGVPARTLRRKAARFTAHGMRSLFAEEVKPAADQRRLPLGIRRAIVELKAEYPPFSLQASSDEGVHIPVTFLTDRSPVDGAADGPARACVFVGYPSPIRPECVPHPVARCGMVTFVSISSV